MLSKIKDLSMNTYRKTCSAANCQKPVKVVVSSAITIMWDADKDIQTNINDYFANSTPYTCDFCPGVTCNVSPRQMLWDNPPVVFMEAFNYPHNFASTITIQYSYSLYAITYGNGGHFVGCVKVPSKGWHFYDGLQLYHGYGLGVRKVMRPYAPTGYRKRNVCYIHVKPLP